MYWPDCRKWLTVSSQGFRQKHLGWLRHLVGRPHQEVWRAVVEDRRVIVDRGTKAKARVWVVVPAVAVDTVVPGGTGFGLGLHHSHPWTGAEQGLASARSWATGRDLGSHYKQTRRGCSCYLSNVSPDEFLKLFVYTYILVATHRTSSYASCKSCSQFWFCC